MVGVSKDFRLRRIFLRPVPFLVQLLREGERILHALDVAARARIPVPVPGAADAAAGLEHPRRKAEPAQPMQHVHPGKTRADDDGVENRVRFERALPLSPNCAVGRHDARRLPAGRLLRPGEALPQHSPTLFSIRRFRWPPMRRWIRRRVAGAANGTYADAKFLSGRHHDHAARSRHCRDHSKTAAARSRDDDAAKRPRCAPGARRRARRGAAAAGRERCRYGGEGRGRAARRAGLPHVGCEIADRGVFPWRRLGRRRSRNP